MKCLHISNDFSNSKVHQNLYTRLDQLGLEQIVFNPVRENTRIGNNHIDFETANSTIIYSKKMKRSHRILFRDKIRFLFKNLESHYDLRQLDIVHATTLFSDGAIALKIYKKYKIPYIIAIRGTDVSLFLKYRPDLSIRLKEILQNARCIIFLGEALKRQFLKNAYVKMFIPDLRNKLKVINNGIDDFWLENLAPKKKVSPEKILYIGRFDYNKNTVGLIDGILKLKSVYPNLKLELVGKGGEYEGEIIKRSELHDFITYHGPIYDKNKLKAIYRANHIFCHAFA